jgi:hypothetical protein
LATASLVVLVAALVAACWLCAYVAYRLLAGPR